MKYNLAFYTYFIGTDSNPAFMIPLLPSETYPCYFFTNNHRLLNKIKKTSSKTRPGCMGRTSRIYESSKI